MSDDNSNARFLRNSILAIIAVMALGVVRRCGTQHHSFDGALVEALAVAPKRDKVSFSRFVPSSAVPLPLGGFEDAIGGIESITISGKRYRFGFEYTTSVATSPLIDDPRVMSQFASDYMLDRDGAHPPEYWEKHVSAAVQGSELTSDPGGRDFTGSEIGDALEEIHAARQDRRPAKLKLPYHLTYLLDATSQLAPPSDTNPCGGELAQRIREVDRHEDCLRGALQIAANEVPPPQQTSYDDALGIIEGYLRHYQRSVPENWRTLLLGEHP